MNYNLTIRQKMMYLVVGLTVLIYVVSIGYISYNLRSNAIKEAEKLADSYAHQKANEIKALLDADMAVARSMKNAVEVLTTLDKPLRDKIRGEFFKDIVKEYPK